MDNNEKKEAFSSFIKKASQRLEDKRREKKRVLYVPSINEEIVIRSLTEAEITECFGIENNLEADDYTVYLAVIDPNLKEVAKSLKEDGKIKEYTEITNIFNMTERTQIVKEIMDLSEVTSDKKVEVVDRIKK